MLNSTDWCKEMHIQFPVIMAPMFLVSNEAMLLSGMRHGIMATFPSLNFRKPGELEQLLATLNNFKKTSLCSGNYGVNLIVQKTNPLYIKHLDTCIDNRVPFFITSLGNPSEVIERAHHYGAKVYCDVTNMEHAEKCASLHCDGFIAVGQGAGGHAGPHPLHILIPALNKAFPSIPVVGAGGIADGKALLSVMAAGAVGASVGTRFIASHEAKVGEAYKQALVTSGMDNIVLTERISGTPCSIINTPYAQKIGLHQGKLEKWLNNNPTIKKYFKMLVQLRGMKKLEASLQPGNYQNLWCAGKSVEMIAGIYSCEQIIAKMKEEWLTAIGEFSKDLKAIEDFNQ